VSRVLVWDFDGTLATRPGHWTGALCEVVTRAYPALGVTPEQLRPHLQRGFPWHAPDVLRDPCSHDEWWAQLRPLFADALRAGAGLDGADAWRLAGALRAHYLDPGAWRLFDDALPVLTRLRERGWRHVVLSNHVPELGGLVETLGLSELLSAVYCSALIGAEKPHPKAFEAVFADHPEARGGWMIGDSWRADVQGARAVGMRAILVREVHPDAAVRCESLHEVMEVVEGASDFPTKEGSPR
jgi:putative hydrolase of the HAD superfamily